MKPTRPLTAIFLGVGLLHAPAWAQAAGAAPQTRADTRADTRAETGVETHTADGWAELERIAAARPETTAYRARFEQQKFSPLLRDPIVSRGVVQMAGGVARWDTDPPHATTVVMDGDTLELYYPDQQTLEIYELGDGIGGLGLAAIATSPVPDLDVLREHFELEGWGFTKGNERLTLTLVPHSDAMRDAVEDVRVAVNTATGHLRSFVVTDLDGEATELTFLDPDADAVIDPASLAFEVPAGTTVVRPLDTAAP